MGRRPIAPQRGLVLQQNPFRDELTSEASEPSEARRAVISQTGATRNRGAPGGPGRQAESQRHAQRPGPPIEL